MNVRTFPTREQGNPFWPLPPDYPELGELGQRQARVNGCRLWTLGYDAIAGVLFPGKGLYSALSVTEREQVRRYKQEAMVGSFHLFNRLYLIPSKDESGQKVWDPLFYGTVVLPRPKFHDDGLRLHAINKYLAEVEPRGSAKSTDLRGTSLMELVTMPGRDIVYTTASHPLAEITGSKIKMQLQDNTLLIDDWSPEYGGHFQPDRGDAPWGVTYFTLRNRASFKISSVESIQRGLRPDKYILDDPEWDPSASTDMQISRDEMEHLLTRVVIPMVQKPGASLVWRGTFVSQRHFLWAAMEDTTVLEDGKVKQVAVMPVFQNWARRIVDVMDGAGKSIWPEMWPTNEAEKVRLGLPEETQTLTQVEQSMGTPAFMAEMRGQPGAGGAAFFGELTERDHGWWLDDATLEDSAHTSPSTSKTLICWERAGQVIKYPLSEFIQRFPTFITLDPAYTENPTSDFKVCTCMAVTDYNELMVLDTWRSNRLPLNVLIREAFQMAERWASVAMCPEKVKEGHTVIAAVNEIVRTQATDVIGVKRLVSVRPINPGVVDKTSKIASLLWRFQHGRIKLPLRSKNTDRWKPLFNQIRDFNPNANDGGLKKDDDIDSVAMSSFVVKLPRAVKGKDPGKNEALERLRKGHKTDAHGFPIILTLPSKDLTEEDLKLVVSHPISKQKGNV